MEKVAPPCPSVLFVSVVLSAFPSPCRCSVLRGGFVAPSAVFAFCLVLSASVAPPFALRRSFPPSLPSPFCRSARSLSPPRGFAPAPPQPGAMCLGLVRPWALPARLRFRVGVCPVLSCCAEVPQKVGSVLFNKLVCGTAVNVRTPDGIQTVTAKKNGVSILFNT